MMKIPHSILATALISGLASIQPALADSSESTGLAAAADRFITEVIEPLGVVPGLAVAVVDKNGAVLTKVYGLADAETGREADAETRFYIASSTKSITALAIAALAERGELDLDAPISSYLPQIALEAPLSADNISLRDLLTHRSGISHTGIGWRTAYSGDHTPEQLTHLINGSEALETGKAFRYSNYGYIIASLILQQEFGADWRQIVADEVLKPAGMDQTTAYPSTISETDLAMPHVYLGKNSRTYLSKKDNTMHAAGGHYTTAHDLARWLEIQLNDGVIDGKRVFPEGVVAGTHEPMATLDANFFTYHRQGYGLGWYISDYEGDTLLHHFGSFSGARGHISFMPEIGLGVAVLMNDASPVTFNIPDLIANFVYDTALGKGDLDAKYADSVKKIVQMKARFSRPPPVEMTAAPDGWQDFAGTYVNEVMGTLVLQIQDGSLEATMGNLWSAITYKDDGAARLELVPFEGRLARFERDEAGKIRGVRFLGEFFTRSPDKNTP